MVLNWWVDGSSALAAREVDDLFLALVLRDRRAMFTMRR
jgi:hypothetical protein